MKRLSFVLIAVSIAMYAVCLTQVGYCTGRSDCTPGYAVLLMGWLGVFGGAFQWVANPVLGVAWVLGLFRQHRMSLFLVIAAALVALSFMLVPSVMKDEAGNMADVTSLGSGYWLWIGSMLVLGIADIVALQSKSQQAPVPAQFPHVPR